MAVDVTNELMTIDGVDANTVWADFVASLGEYNAEQDALVASLTFPTQQENFQVIQGTFEFETYADYTQPDTHDLEEYSVSTPINDWDLRIAYTFAKILETTRQELDARHSEALAADVRLQMRQALRAAFVSAGVYYNGVKGTSFYNNDGFVPPSYKTNTFSGTHTHYLASDSALGTLLSSAIDHVAEHGFETDLVILGNRAMCRLIAAETDFIPVQGSIGSSNLQVNAPGGDGVVGWFDGATICREDWIPANYFFCYSRIGGANSSANPIAMRESTSAAARGLIIMRGTNPEYPLVNSFYYHKFGMSVRQRGNGVCAYIGADSYADPTF